MTKFFDFDWLFCCFCYNLFKSLVMVNWIFVFYGSSFWRPNSSSYFFVDVKKKEISITSPYYVYLLKLHLHLIMCKQQENYSSRWFEVSSKSKLQSSLKNMLFGENSYDQHFWIVWQKFFSNDSKQFGFEDFSWK